MLAIVLSALAALVSLPDIIPSGWKMLRVDARLELGALANRVRLVHVVVEGDTLGSLAKTHLGSVARWKEIAELNPGVDPRRMAPGQRLELPVRELRATDAEASLVYVDLWRPRPSTVERFTTTGRLRSAPRSQLGVFVVPVSMREAFLAAAKRGTRALDEFAKRDEVGRYFIECRSPFAQTGDPIHSRRDVYRLVAAEDGALSIELRSSEAFDEDGQPIGEKRVDEDRDDALLLLLAAGGIVGLAIAAARRASGRATPVPLTP